MLSADKVNEIFCIADDFCKVFDESIEKERNDIKLDSQ